MSVVRFVLFLFPRFMRNCERSIEFYIIILTRKNMEVDFPPDSVEKIWRLTSAAPSEDMDSIKNVRFFFKAWKRS